MNVYYGKADGGDGAGTVGPVNRGISVSAKGSNRVFRGSV